MSSPYEMAKKEGYSDEEILGYLQTHPKYGNKIQEARNEGYSDQEISQFLSTYNPKKKEKPSKLKKAARIGEQFALGAAESALMPYEIAVAPLASKDSQNVAYREILGEDLERLMEQKAMGLWDEQDQQLYDSIVQQLKSPKESEKFTQTADIGIRGLTEKLTGQDLHPEGILEKAAHWTGFIKKPQNIARLAQSGLTPKEVIKAISPSGKEIMQGLGAGAALEIAEDGDYGPIGTMAAAVVGDILGSGAAGLGKALATPKKSLSKLAAKLPGKEKLEIQKDLIKSFRDSGIQADIGTLTDSNLVKMMQSRLSQSGLTGKALDELRTNITNQIKEEYKAIAESLGEARFATSHEAGESIKEGIRKIRDADLSEARELYTRANESLKEKAWVNSKRIGDAIDRLETQLKPGAIKSGEQKAVLDAVEKLKQDVYDSSGRLMYANVKDLINNKIALNDIINYEVQGGAKQLLKGLVGELDRAIISHGKDNPGFAKNYIRANKKFSEHAKTFRSRTAEQLLRAEDPSTLMNKMNSVHGIKNISNILSKSPEGAETLKNLKRFKLEQVIGDKLVDSTTQQVKLGTFSKLLEKGKNKEIVKELLGNQSFKRLEKLQKNSGKLAETANKFLNPSKSGVVVEDMYLVSQSLKDIGSAIAGNPWALLRSGSAYLGLKYISKLISDPEFLKLTEEAILASNRNDSSRLFEIGKLLADKIKTTLPAATLSSIQKDESMPNQ